MVDYIAKGSFGIVCSATSGMNSVVEASNAGIATVTKILHLVDSEVVPTSRGDDFIVIANAQQWQQWSTCELQCVNGHEELRNKQCIKKESREQVEQRACATEEVMP